MPASKAQQKAVHKYTKENYDRFLVTMRPKGHLDTIKAAAAAAGESVNAYINTAITQRMERENPSEAAGAISGAGAVSLPSGNDKATQRAEKGGEWDD